MEMSRPAGEVCCVDDVDRASLVVDDEIGALGKRDAATGDAHRARHYAAEGI